MRLDWIDHKAAKYAVEHWHYSRTLPRGKLAKLGVWEDDRFVGAVVFSMATDAVPALRRLLNDHSTVSMPASDAIHRITGDPADVITLGINLLDHEDWLQRCVGAEHLSLLGTKAHLAVPRLQWTALADENDIVRNTAKAALNEIEV